jgi:hypothetical protein
MISISSAGESVSIGSSTMGARRSSGTIEGVYTGSAKNCSSSSMKPKEVGYQIFVVNCRGRRGSGSPQLYLRRPQCLPQ